MNMPEESSAASQDCLNPPSTRTAPPPDNASRFAYHESTSFYRESTPFCRHSTAFYRVHTAFYRESVDTYR